MNNSNKSSLAYVFNAIIPMMEATGIGLFAANSVWSMVLGVLPKSDGEREKKMMEFSSKDTTEDKVDNIKTITKFANLITKRHDFEISNLTDFTYAIRQLIRYSNGDEIASSALSKLKKIYISYITSYYHKSMTLGKKTEAIDTLKYFGEDILKEDEEIAKQLAEISAFKMLS
jgi:hypothetical protein